MKSNIKFFKKSRTLPVDEFFKNVLYDNKFGYYSSKLPFGEKGDYITAPKISYLFSEMIAIWIITTWELFGKPKKLNIVELGPGDGSLSNILIKTFKKFPEFNLIKKIYLYEESGFLKKIQKKNIADKNVKWISNFSQIKNGPVIFFGNEFFDAIPIKQFKRVKNVLFEKNYTLDKNYKIKEIFKKASASDIKVIRSYKILRSLKFIEFPKNGLRELKKIIKKISKLGLSNLLILRYRSACLLNFIFLAIISALSIIPISSKKLFCVTTFLIFRPFFLKNSLRSAKLT